jgi:hypothetical protein
MKWAALIGAAFGLLPGFVAAQNSNAAKYLMAQEVALACEGAGTFDPRGVIETDLNGDGRADLILSHEWITCTGTSTRSGYCGMQVCTVKIYVRESALLRKKVDFLGGGVTVGPTDVPVISGYAHGGDPWAIRWNGKTFR